MNIQPNKNKLVATTIELLKVCTSISSANIYRTERADVSSPTGIEIQEILTCMTLDLLRIVFPDGWYRSMSLSIPRTPTSSASTRRKAVILTKLYLKSSRSKVSISWKRDRPNCRVFAWNADSPRGPPVSRIGYLRKSWRDSGTCSRSFAAAGSIWK